MLSFVDVNYIVFGINPTVKSLVWNGLVNSNPLKAYYLELILHSIIWPSGALQFIWYQMNSCLIGNHTTPSYFYIICFLALQNCASSWIYFIIFQRVSHPSRRFYVNKDWTSTQWCYDTGWLLVTAGSDGYCPFEPGNTFSILYSPESTSITNRDSTYTIQRCIHVYFFSELWEQINMHINVFLCTWAFGNGSCSNTSNSSFMFKGLKTRKVKF